MEKSAGVTRAGKFSLPDDDRLIASAHAAPLFRTKANAERSKKVPPQGGSFKRVPRAPRVERKRLVNEGAGYIARITWSGI
jgi:hypothetical protein